MLKTNLHTTIGLYPDLTFKMNGVHPEHLTGHVQFNKKFRPGRTLFVDGVCVHNGGIPDEVIKIHEQLFKSDKYKMKKSTVPYV